MGVRYMICHWAINRTDPQNSLSTTLDVPLHFRWEPYSRSRLLPRVSPYNVLFFYSDILCNFLVRLLKLQARIKPIALCSAIDKENSIEFLLDFLHYLYNYYMVCALLSHAYHVTHHVTLCDVIM